MVSAMTPWRWYMTIGSMIVAAEVGYHVFTWRSLQAQFPDLIVTTAIVPPPCSSSHFFGTYVYSKVRGGRQWRTACRDWGAGRWILFEWPSGDMEQPG